MKQIFILTKVPTQDPKPSTTLNGENCDEQIYLGTLHGGKEITPGTLHSGEEIIHKMLQVANEVK
jgi:hypothetical protein